MAKKGSSQTKELAYYLWHDIQGNEGSPFDDVMFVRRYMSMSKKVLSQGADVEVLKVAMDLMKSRENIIAHSPQQCIDWVDRKTNKPFYELAKEQIEKADKQPPVYEAAAYAEWLIHMGREDELEEVFKVECGSEVE